jgi:hypothetical protein
MVYNKKTQRKRSKSASKSRRRSRGGDIEEGTDGNPNVEGTDGNPNVDALMKPPPNRSISPTNAPLPTYAQAMKSRTPTTSSFDVLDAAEKGFGGPHLVGGRRRKGRRSKKTRKGKRSTKKRSKKTRKGKRSTKKKSLFGKLFGL